MLRPALVLMLATTACVSDYHISKPPPASPLVPGNIDVFPPAVTADEPEPDAPAPVEDTGEVPPEEEPAPAPVYAHTTNELFEVDPVTGHSLSLGTFHDGPTPIRGVIDLAIDMNGRLFAGTRGGDDDQPRAIYRVSPYNASLQHICDTDAAMFALTFLPDGRLVAGSEGLLVVIDVDHDCATSVLLHHPTWITSGDIVALPDGLIYWTLRRQGEPDALAVFDPRTNLYGTRGVIGYDRLFGLAYDDDTQALYGFSGDGEIVEIRPSDAHSVLLNDSAKAWWGAATNPAQWQQP